VSFLQLGFDYLATTQNGEDLAADELPPADSYTYLAFPDLQTVASK
jgi:hypothetical protein